jgi:hypothetical protein
MGGLEKRKICFPAKIEHLIVQQRDWGEKINDTFRLEDTVGG